MPRESFSDETKRTLAQRAAYRCSFPNCNRLTIGPGTKDDDVENTGHAAHVYSASAGGPRGQGSLSSAQIKAASNGIWLCAVHSNLIDKNTGIRYPAPVIKGWKALHEHRIAYEHSGRTTAFGFVRTLYVDQSSLFKPQTEIELGKTTFVIGQNDTGKTALCEWLSAIDSLDRLQRWLEPTPLAFKVTFDAPVEHHLSVTTGDGSIQIELDGSAVAFNHHRIAVAFVQNKRDWDYQDDLAHLSVALSLDVVSTQSLAGLVKDNAFYVRGARFKRELENKGEWKTNLYCTLADGAERSFGSMSTGEQGRVILEFAITHVRSVAAFAPSLLIIEWPGLGIDDTGFQSYLEYFSRADCAFQTLISMFKSTPLIEGLGWQTYQIRRENQLSSVTPIVPR